MGGEGTGNSFGAPFACRLLVILEKGALFVRRSRNPTGGRGVALFWGGGLTTEPLELNGTVANAPSIHLGQSKKMPLMEKSKPRHMEPVFGGGGVRLF